MTIATGSVSKSNPNIGVSPAALNPTAHSPAAFSRTTASALDGWIHTRSCSKAPAAALNAVGPSGADLRSGTTRPVIPAATADLAIAPTLCGSCLLYTSDAADDLTRVDL